MKEESNNNHNIIKKALENIEVSINASSLPNNEKHALILLADKLTTYYDKKLMLLAKRGIDIHSNNTRIMILESFMADILVEINDVLVGDNDVYYFISVINNRLNDKEIEKVTKRKVK